MLKVLFVFGTRPEAIKLAPLIQRMAEHRSFFDFRICITAQHRQMLDQALELFRIQPDYDLNVMEDNQSPTQVAAAVLSRLEAILEEDRPDWVIVQGDTASAAAAAWAAFHAGAKIGHVEAGLRTNDKLQPFPEEINRRLITLVADLHFASTEQSRLNLLKEGVSDEHIRVTGNTIVDALRWALQIEPTAQITDLLHNLKANGQIQKIILVTAHRRENFGLPLENICTALRTIVGNYGQQVQVVFNVHPNPNVASLVTRMLGDTPGVTLLPPLDYVSMAHLLNESHLVVTDSGGVQEESTSLGKPLLVIRKKTDRPESVDAGTARVVGVETETVIKHLMTLLDEPEAYESMAKVAAVFGEGDATQKIITALLDLQP